MCPTVIFELEVESHVASFLIRSDHNRFQLMKASPKQGTWLIRPDPRPQMEISKSILGSCSTGGTIWQWPCACEFHNSVLALLNSFHNSLLIKLIFDYRPPTTSPLPSRSIPATARSASTSRCRTPRPPSSSSPSRSPTRTPTETRSKWTPVSNV